MVPVTNTTAANTSVFTFTRGMPISVHQQPYGVAIVDFDADGHADIAVTSSGDVLGMSNGGTDVVLGRGPGQGGFLPRMAASTVDANFVVFTDVDDDAKPDLVIAQTDGELAIVLGRTPPRATTLTLGVPRLLATGTSPLQVVAADLNRDHAPDFVTANSGSNNLTVVFSQ